jgi:hypothetical protein
MSQTKSTVPKLRVYTKEGATGVSSGMNTLVELDGKPLPSVSFVKIECKAKAITKVQLEMYVQLDIDLKEVKVDITEIPKKNIQKEQFITERTRIISKMLDNPGEYGIYKTSEAFAELDDLFDKMVGSDKLSIAQEIRNNK